jgi:DNA modification methylase
MTQFQIHNCDVIEGLQRIEKETIDCIITSPPYWGLRDYGVSKQIGLEPHPQQWINKMVQVSQELKRVLKPSGSYWLNVGDTYFTHASGSKKYSHNFKEADVAAKEGIGTFNKPRPDGSQWLKEKQKMLMPHRLAIALQDDGWILRNDCVWHKPSHMPSSVQDRLTNSFEFVFHFVKQRKYFYDLDAIREPHSEINLKRAYSKNNPEARKEGNKNIFAIGVEAQDKAYEKLRQQIESGNIVGKNPGDAWKEVPYAVQPRIKDFVEVRDLPDLNKFAMFLNDFRKASKLTIDEVEARFGNQAPHHWFNGECFPSKEDYLKLKELIGFPDDY